MSEQKPIDETQPNQPISVEDIHQSVSITPGEAITYSKPRKTWLWVVGGLLAVLLIVGLGSLGGYTAGINMRKAADQNNRDVAAALQFQLGIADFQAGRYEFAKQRFAYVIQLNPAFPGAMEAMAKVTIIMSATATPTVAPSPTAAPTLDMSGAEALLAQAKQLLAAQDWNGTMNALDILRKNNPTFKTLEVDGLYYKALRYRGIQKILQVGNLEGGIYDFAMMQRFGPVDREVRDTESWAVMYINAAKYWIVDWKSAIKYLAEIYPYFPGLMDGSSRTVADRYRESLARYGDELLQQEKWCTAEEYYLQSFALGTDKKFQENYTRAHNKCAASQPTEIPPTDIVPTDEVIPTEVTPSTEPPTAEPPTAEPTAG